MVQDKAWSTTDSAISASLFSLFVLAGSAYIIAAKLLHYPAFLVTSVPVAVMVVYALVIVLLRRFRLRLDQAGDNIYYMGFLFTLTSLGVSLYQFQAEGAVEEIVRNFGVAIASTIAGVALRVLFGQMRQDPYEVELASRLELSEATRRVRRELDTIVIEIANFRRSSQQMITEGFGEAREGVRDATSRALGDFEDLTRKAAGPIEASADASATILKAFAKSAFESVEAANTKFAAETAKLSEGTDRLAATLEAVSDHLKSLQVPANVIEEKLQPSVGELTQAVSQLSNSVATFIEHNSPMTPTQLLDTEAKRNARIDNLAEAIASLTRQMEGAAAAKQSRPLRYIRRLLRKSAAADA
ncbi:hypothetical protein BA190_06110 [Labrys sp. WJW]|uniref:hypothetical protein n=1 Tax=Labrys sp. WJW TaxID=1737983 RepID=UPI00082D7B03|nr:hypothetical protein [Labrys sp. WJW]OCC05804.1 hypothetical protein BA190_06110 [Labrys sp. WJW]